MDMGHVLGAGQLAVRDVEEISSSGQATEKVPGSTVGLIVRYVAAGNLEVQRNCTVLGHCENVKQLLKVWAMILVVTPGDRHPGPFTPCFFLGRVSISTMEGDGGGVVVELVEVHLEFLDHMGHQRQDQ